MKIFKYKTWPIYVAYKDIINFIIFKKSINNEIKNPNSKFNKLKLKRNWLGNVLYVQTSLEDNFELMPEADKNIVLMNKLKPIHEYFSKDLGVSEYITPQFNNFLDEEGNSTLSYGILYIFNPYKFSFTWLIKWIIILGALLYGCFKLYTYLNI